MIWGSKEDGSGVLELTKAEQDLLKAGKPVIKRSGDSKGHFKVVVKLTRPRAKKDRFKGL